MFLKFLYVVILACLFSMVPLNAQSQEIDCLTCHAGLKRHEVVHAALGMGCLSCHSGIDARTVPHKKAGGIAKGLAAEQPELCYSCHDNRPFGKKNLHAAVGMGCTGCHNPHSSKNRKLLKAEVPELCFTCHEKAAFSKRVVHGPAGGGMCLACHTPHSSNEIALLNKKPYELCLGCHADIAGRPHAVSGFTAGSHPLGEGKKTLKGEVKELKDPARPNRPFYCGSCHDPHSSDVNRLFRFNAKSGMDLCTNCHRM